jgi:hypothetical protein
MFMTRLQKFETLIFNFFSFIQSVESTCAISLRSTTLSFVFNGVTCQTDRLVSVSLLSSYDSSIKSFHSIEWMKKKVEKSLEFSKRSISERFDDDDESHGICKKRKTNLELLCLFFHTLLTSNKQSLKVQVNVQL